LDRNDVVEIAVVEDVCDSPTPKVRADHVSNVLASEKGFFVVPPAPKILVKYRREGTTDTQYLAVMPASSTFRDLLPLASKRGVSGSSVKFEDCTLDLDDEINPFGKEAIFEIPADPVHDPGLDAVLGPVPDPVPNPVLGPVPSPAPDPGPDRAPPKPLRELDLVFVIDATGSMAPAIQAAHDRSYRIAEAFRRSNRKLNLQIGSVCYRDPIDSPIDGPPQCHDLNPSLFVFQDFLKTVRATGGRDGPEDWVGALNSVLALGWRPTAIHTVIWLADAPAHGSRYCGTRNHEEEGPKLEPLVNAMIDLNVKFVGFSIKSGALKTFAEMKKIYQQRNPKLLFTFDDFRDSPAAGQNYAATFGTAMSGTIRLLARDILPDDDLPQGQATFLLHKSCLVRDARRV
jgi:hypothetical protein